MNGNDKKGKIEEIKEIILSDRKFIYLRKRLNIEVMIEIMKSLMIVFFNSKSFPKMHYTLQIL